MSPQSEGVARWQLQDSPALNLVVHAYQAVGNEGFGIGAGLDETGEPQELPEADDIVGDRHFVYGHDRQGYDLPVGE